MWEMNKETSLEELSVLEMGVTAPCDTVTRITGHSMAVLCLTAFVLIYYLAVGIN